MTTHYEMPADEEIQTLAAKHGWSVEHVEKFIRMEMERDEKRYQQALEDLKRLSEFRRFLPEAQRQRLAEFTTDLVVRQVSDIDTLKEMIEEARQSETQIDFRALRDRLTAEARTRFNFDQYVDDVQPLIRLGFLAGMRMILALWIDGLGRPDELLASVEEDLREALDEKVQ
jgi:hypothetical protein